MNLSTPYSNIFITLRTGNLGKHWFTKLFRLPNAEPFPYSIFCLFIYCCLDTGSNRSLGCLRTHCVDQANNSWLQFAN